MKILVLGTGAPQADLIRALEALPQTMLYSDFASAIYRGLAALNIPTRIAVLPVRPVSVPGSTSEGEAHA